MKRPKIEPMRKGRKGLRTDVKRPKIDRMRKQLIILVDGQDRILKLCSEEHSAAEPPTKQSLSEISREASYRNVKEDCRKTTKQTIAQRHPPGGIFHYLTFTHLNLFFKISRNFIERVKN